MEMVWILVNSKEDIHLFKDTTLLLPSVQFSYHGCKDVVIEHKYTAVDAVFKITGLRGGEKFSDTVIFQRRPIWDAACHL